MRTASLVGDPAYMPQQFPYARDGQLAGTARELRPPDQRTRRWAGSWWRMYSQTTWVGT